MRNNKIVILHVFVDGLIFSDVANSYDSLVGVDNLYYYFLPEKNYHLQNINDERVIIITDFEEYIGYFSNPEIDVILFYSLPYQYYYLFDYIDDNKLVIWWAWGYDLYYGQGKYPPLIPLKEMYKPLTKRYMASCVGSKVTTGVFFSLLHGMVRMPFRFFRHFVHGRNILPKPHRTQKEILARIDLFYSPLDIEYDFLKEAQISFTARRNISLSLGVEIPFVYKEEIGNILINHSLTYTDNHLDVFNYLKDIKIPDNRQFIVPISYGVDGFDGKPEKLIKLSPFDERQVIWLTTVLPKNDYYKILGSVTHAVFGALRQQSLGNILWCLRKGVKVYLFEDSVLFKELKNEGYIVFSIEKDLGLESISKCLSEQDARTNHSVFINKRKNNTKEYRVFLEKSIMEKHRLVELNI